MATSRFGRWSGLAAVVGGALWVIVFAIHAARSSAEGWDEFYVSLSGLGVAGLLSVLLVAVGFVGLDMHMPSDWGGPGYGNLGRAGYVVALVGILMLILSDALGSFDMLGIFVLMVGSLLVGVAALTRRVLPRWGAIALIVGSLSLLVFLVTQGLIVWLGVPYGAAWIAVGYLLFLGRSGQFQTASRVR
jgi:hypothetical protein